MLLEECSYLGALIFDGITLELDMCPFGVDQISHVDLLVRERLLVKD